ncbi:hypothetical protein VNO77_42285 [Canavalia gladiata]|uniref:Uncharacterized protein n=1 Tax=Canavalia gladiata TaxID=3824 RepID=A0AAN9JZY9_CANGL
MNKLATIFHCNFLDVMFVENADLEVVFAENVEPEVVENQDDCTYDVYVNEDKSFKRSSMNEDSEYEPLDEDTNGLD